MHNFYLKGLFGGFCLFAFVGFGWFCLVFFCGVCLVWFVFTEVLCAFLCFTIRTLCSEFFLLPLLISCLTLYFKIYTTDPSLEIFLFLSLNLNSSFTLKLLKKFSYKLLTFTWPPVTEVQHSTWHICDLESSFADKRV